MEEIKKELDDIVKKILKERRYTTKTTTGTGDTDLSPSGDFGHYFKKTIIPKEVDNGYEEEKVGVIDDKEWKRNKNKLQKMDWEQPEPAESDFAAKDVQDVASKEMARLKHNKSSYKKAYKKHELPDIQGFAHLQKMEKGEKGDPLYWRYYRQYFKPDNKMKR